MGPVHWLWTKMIWTISDPMGPLSGRGILGVSIPLCLCLGEGRDGRARTGVSCVGKGVISSRNPCPYGFVIPTPERWDRPIGYG
jgi:hypothetical protein